jgi:uncharacterized surface protein with fasciclin (FAS1) repeats
MKDSLGVVRRLVVVAALVLVVGTGFALGGCGSEESSAAAGPAGPSASAFDGTVADALAGDEALSSYSEAVIAAGLAETLAGTGPYTVFAPDNDAVTGARVTLDEDYVKASIVEGVALTMDELRAVSESDTLLADNKVVTIVGSDDGVYANTMKIVGGPVECSNGMVYVLEGVITPKD